MRKILRFLKALTTVLVFASSTDVKAATEWTFLEESAVFGLVQGVFIEIDDKVEDKCWTNPKAIKDKMMATLQQNNIPIITQVPWRWSPFYPLIRIRGTGSRDESGSCFGQGEVAAIYFVEEEYISQERGSFRLAAMPVIMFIGEGIFSSPRNLNDDIAELADGFSAAFASRVTSGRSKPAAQRMMVVRPDLRDFVSRERFQELITEALNAREREGNQ